MPNIATLELKKPSYIVPVEIIEQSAKDLSNYAIRIELTKENFDLWDKIGANAENLYVVDENYRVIPYWFEEIDMQNYFIRLWAKIPSIPANSKKKIFIFIESPNPYPDYRDPSKVFTFFDDFIGGLDTTKWGLDTDAWSGDDVIYTGGSDNEVYLKEFTVTDGILESKTKLDTGARGNIKIRADPNCFGAEAHSAMCAYDFNGRYPNSDIRLRKFTSAGEVDLQVVSHTWDTEFHIWGISAIGSKLKLWLDYTEITSAVDTDFASGTIAFGSDRIDSGCIYFDWIRVRPFTDPEPTVNVYPAIIPYKGTYDLY